MINLMEIPRELAIKWIVDTKAISAFTRNFVEWLYANGFFIGNNGGGDINFNMRKKINEWYEKLDK
jgi:hypothetical protein